MMRFVNVAVSDIAALLGKHPYDSRGAALERIRRRGGIRWRQRKSKSRGRFDEFACLRHLPASHAFVDKLKNHPMQFSDRGNGRHLLMSIENDILADAMATNVKASSEMISSFVNTELGKAMETEVIRGLQRKHSCRFQDRQRYYERTWTHPKDKSIRVHLNGYVDASYFDRHGKMVILEIKCRRHGFRTVQRHEVIQLKTYLTLARCDRGILLQSFAGENQKKLVKRNDGWFYGLIKAAIDDAALQIARKKQKKSSTKK